MSGQSPTDLEAFRQERINLLAATRRGWWGLAHADADALDTFGPAIAGTLAADEGVSKAYILQRAQVFRTFPDAPEDVPYSKLRAILLAAKRLGRPAGDVLDEAMPLSLRQVQALGARRAHWRGQCPTCDASVSVAASRDRAGQLVSCAVCQHAVGRLA